MPGDPLEALGQDIEKAKKASDKGKEGAHPEASAGADILRVCVELSAGVGVGGLIGYALDRWLSTMPLFLTICIIFGFSGSLMNIYRYLQRSEMGNK
ncbi:MAG: putative F0F1-ATPase subunit Ca2+/Mg2+ transporter [Rickettsiales bacterium]|nr:putative F0F1-ATPase subunit Ca2+/Mg2+ transporter [Rickettsiales bacterium]